MLTEEIRSVESVIYAIASGVVDDELDTIQSAISQRKKHHRDMRAMIAKSKMKANDTVRFVNGRPKYLNGLLATVVRLNPKKVVIRFNEGQLPPGARYTGEVTCPAELLELVESA